MSAEPPGGPPTPGEARTGNGPDVPDVPCRDFVEQITAYLEGALDAGERAAVDAHLAVCAGCRAALEQFRIVIGRLGRLAGADVDAVVDRVDPAVRDELLAAFRASRGTAGT